MLSGKMRIIETQQLDSHNSGGVLTERTKLVCAGSCTSPSLQGAPCPNPLNTVSWLPGSFELNIRINGVRVLNDKAKKICSVGAAVVTCSVNASAVAAGIMIPFVPGISGIAAAGASPVNAAPAAVESSTPVGSELSEGGTKGIADTEKTTVPEAENATEKEPENAQCDYENCPKREQCEYLRASSELLMSEGVWQTQNKNGKVINHNTAASILRKNAAEMYEEYRTNDQCLQEKERMSWSDAAHHLISIKAAFGKYPRLVKLAHFYGYDINCSENCIFLPTNKEKEFSQKVDVYKQISASTVMDITNKQWHVGGHQYKISKTLRGKIPEKDRARLKAYNELINAETERVLENFLEYKGMGTSCCFYDSRETLDNSRSAEVFRLLMNDLSSRVRSKLDAFSSPKESFPYFVSRQALEYAYLLPRSGKVVCAIFNSSGEKKGWKLILYQYERYKKNYFKVELTEKETMITDYYLREKTPEIISFFSNARHFFVFDKKERVVLPFTAKCTTYYIHSVEDEYSIFSDDGRLIRRFPIDKRISSRSIISELAPVVEVVLRNDAQDDYMTPDEMRNARRKECGIV